MRHALTIIAVVFVVTVAPAQACGGQGSATLYAPVAFLGSTIAPTLSAAPTAAGGRGGTEDQAFPTNAT